MAFGAHNVEYSISLRDRFSAKLKGVNASMTQFDKTVKRTNSNIVGMGKMMLASFGSAAVLSALKNMVTTMADFEETASNLGAITGATGVQLDFLKRKAIEMGGASTKSAKDTLEAFKLIASAKPELLTNARALAAVTKEAITLSEASGLQLPEAANALTTALNQFSLSADESSRIINVLAASAKFGSAEIPELTAGLAQFGGIANTFGASVEESAALMEVLSEKSIKGSEAGTKLRNIFLLLSKTGRKDLNPSIVGIRQALKNLAPIQNDATALTKIFKMENIDAALALVQNTARLDDLTKAVNGTSEAYIAASKNTDNFNSTQRSEYD